MAERSTRDKMRWNVWRASDRMLEAIGNLKHVADLAEGRSQLINEHLPAIVTALEEVHTTLLAFREEL